MAGVKSTSPVMGGNRMMGGATSPMMGGTTSPLMGGTSSPVNPMMGGSPVNPMMGGGSMNPPGRPPMPNQQQPQANKPSDPFADLGKIFILSIKNPNTNKNLAFTKMCQRNS